MKSLTICLSRAGRPRILGWNPRDKRHLLLETLDDMSQNWSVAQVYSLSFFKILSSITPRYTPFLYSLLLNYIAVLIL